MTYRATWEFGTLLLASVSVVLFWAYVPCVIYLLWWIIEARNWQVLVVGLPMLAGAFVWGYGLATALAKSYRISFEGGVLEWVAIGTLLPSRMRVELVGIRGIYQLRPNCGIQRIELVGEKRAWVLRGALSEADARVIMQEIFDHAKAVQGSDVSGPMGR